MRVLLDTNVLVSAILFRGVPRSPLERALRGEIDLVTSPALLEELEKVLIRKLGFAQEVTRATRGELEALADVVVPQDVRRVARDAHDDHVLAAALAGGAQIIITGDRDRLELRTYEGIEILAPAERAWPWADQRPARR